MSATPLTDAYLASRCKGENKQSWVEFAQWLEGKLRETKAEQEPVAWRFKNNPGDAWEYRAYPPSGVGPNAVIEPLYGHPWTLPKIGVYDPKTGACNEECDCVIGQICRGYIAYSDAKNAPK